MLFADVVQIMSVAFNVLLWSEPAALFYAARCTLQACGPGTFLGSTSASNTCQNCAPGTYSGAATGASVCTNCLANFYSKTTAQSCTSCGTNANSAAGSVDGTFCKCNAGYWGALLTSASSSSMTCTVMSNAPGLFSSCCVLADGMPMLPVAINLLLCPDPAAALPYPLQACPAGTFSSAVGATGSCTCVLCSAGKASVAGSSVCTDCDAGKYLASSGAGTTPDTCTSCGVNANSPAFSVSHTACSCSAGYWGPALTVAGTAITCTVMSHDPVAFVCADGVPMVPVALKPAAVL
jgi:hypothetical protein